MYLQEVQYIQDRIQKKYNILSYRDILSHRIIYQELKETESFQAINDCVIMYLIGPTFSFDSVPATLSVVAWRLSTRYRKTTPKAMASSVLFSFFFMPLFLPLLPTFFISGWWWSPSLVLPPSSLWPYLLGKKEVVRHSVSGGKHQGG